MHMNQVHKENLTHVENAIPGRQGLDIEIFGMEGVPGDILDQHNQQVTQKHFAEEAERARITGNPVRGQFSNGTAPPTKRPKVAESLDEIEERANKFRHDRQNGILPAPPIEVVPIQLVSRRSLCSKTKTAMLTAPPRLRQPHNNPTASRRPLPPQPPTHRSSPLCPMAAYPGGPVAPRYTARCRRGQALATQQRQMHRPYRCRWMTSLGRRRRTQGPRSARRTRRRRAQTSSWCFTTSMSARRRRWRSCRGLRRLHRGEEEKETREEGGKRRDEMR